MIGGVVLAAGRSQRMGRSKALLEIDGMTFLERAIGTLGAGGCDEVVAVLDPDDRGLDERVREAGGHVAWSPGSGSEQIESLRAGLQAFSRPVEAAVVQPVDHPLVRSSTVQLLIQTFRDRRPPVAIPVWQGRRGHPTLFSATVFHELLEGPAPAGARTVVHAHDHDALELDAGDEGIVVDVDTPEDYETIGKGVP